MRSRFEFLDRLGHRETLSFSLSESVESVLRRYHIPPASVIVFRDGHPVPDDHPIELGAHYEAALIEGYDLGAIRAAYSEMARPSPGIAVYSKRLLSFSTAGTIETEATSLTLEELAKYVEWTVYETCVEYDLIKSGDRVLVALSGGVDSSSLLIVLSRLRERLGSFELLAVTFEDFDSQHSPTFEHARALAKRLGVEHRTIPAALVEEVFHLRGQLRDILPRLMATRAAHHVMYVDHHTTRRGLEVYAERNGLNLIAIGLHTTDLVASLLNGWLTGYSVAGIPARDVGHFNYIYPLAFVKKRELHLYHLQVVGTLARHSHPNPWETNPLDRNFYYYLADQLQAYWPGIETLLFTGHAMGARSSQPSPRYEPCNNCGAAVMHQPFTLVKSNECDVCQLLRQEGYIEGHHNKYDPA